MADEAAIPQQNEVQVPLVGETQGMPLGAVPEPAGMPAPEPVAMPVEGYQPGPEAAFQPAPEPVAMPQTDVASQLAPNAGFPQQLPPEAASSTMPQPMPDESPAPRPDPVQPKTVVVRTGRLVIDVAIPDVRFRHSTPRLAAFVVGQYPDLPHHACVNEVGSTFGYVMERTSVAHMLEHLMISEQVRSQGSGEDTFVGTTEWLDENAGIARIEVGFKDDLVALRAFNDATRFLNMAVLTCLA